MFLKTETGTFVNVDSIQAIEVLEVCTIGEIGTKGNEHLIKLWMADECSYTGAIYNNKEDAKYALNFLFTLIQNTRDENRMFYEIPTQDDVDIYKWADKIDKDLERTEENGRETNVCKDGN